ncbi:MAG: hypothetical protein LBD85_02915 [Oscillospiraceae bacterium]|jgi:hypothetical protein|nr:hypothetical protein [Oscillospiraceae bacterium]
MDEGKLIFSDDMTPEQLERWYKEWELSDAPDEEKEEWRNIWTQVVKSYKAHKKFAKLLPKIHSPADDEMLARFANVELLAGVLTRALGAEVLRDEDADDDIGDEDTHSVGLTVPKFVFEGETKNAFIRMLADVNEIDLFPGSNNGVTSWLFVNAGQGDKTTEEPNKESLPLILPISPDKQSDKGKTQNNYHAKAEDLSRAVRDFLIPICKNGNEFIEDFREGDKLGVRFRVDELLVRSNHISKFIEVIKIADKVEILPEFDSDDGIESIIVEFSVKK